MDQMLGAVAVAGLWLLREVSGHVVDRFMTRVGRVRLLGSERQFIKTFHLADGTTVEGAYIPFATDEADGSNGHTVLGFTGTLLNEAKAPVILESVQLDFSSPRGPGIVHSNPSIHSRCRSGSVLVLEPNTPCPFTIRTTLLLSRLEDVYLDSQAVLVARTTAGRQLRFRLGSVYGSYLLRTRGNGSTEVQSG